MKKKNKQHKKHQSKRKGGTQYYRTVKLSDISASTSSIGFAFEAFEASKS